MLKPRFDTIRVNVVQKPRFSVMEGRDFIVLPIVILTEGVHSGSGGPILYMLEDMEKFAPAWNHKPIVVNHPKKDGEFVSADDPAILSSYKVGILMANKVSGKRQEAEAWLEKDRLKKVDHRILDAMEEGIIVEVSTGLFSDFEDEPGVWNEEEYDGIARNYRPDHLALLPDLVGACSVAKGCGMFTAAQGLSLNQAKEVQTVLKKVLSNGDEEEEHPITDFAFASDPKDPETWILPIYNEETMDESIAALEKDDSQIPEKARPTVKARLRNAWKKYGKKKKKKSQYLNELSHGDLGSKLYEAICAPQYEQSYHWIQEVYDDCVIYGNGEELYKQEFSITDDDEVELVGDPQLVKKEVSYTPIGNETMPKNSSECKCTKEIKDLVDNLISNGKNWKEEDREYLETQDEKILKKFQALETPKEEPKKDPPKDSEVETNTEEAPVGNKKRKEMTEEEYIRRAPASIRKVLMSGLQAHKAHEKRLIDTIMSNESNEFSEDELAKMAFPTLQKLAALAVHEEEESKENESLDIFNYNYIGNAGAPQGNSTHQQEALELPVMNFNKEKK